VITEFKGENRFLSNFFESPIVFKGITFPTAEHAFQAAKARSVEDMLWVAESDTPGIAKRRGRQVTLRRDWEESKISEMYLVCHMKFKTPELEKRLMMTSPQHLIEGNYWHDQFWGDCLCDTHKDIQGRNYLGRILMHIREAKFNAMPIGLVMK
jgi:ribA/ribD-fused uncharacterized protein